VGSPSAEYWVRLLVLDSVFGHVTAIFETIEDQLELRMSTRRMRLVGHEVLFRNVGDIGRVLGFGKDMVVGLIFTRANLGGNRQPPFLRVIEEGIHVEDHSAKRTKAMDHHFSDPEFRFSHNFSAFVPAIAHEITMFRGRKIADPRGVEVALGSRAGIR
jgi:hypothetical protein